MQSVQLLKAVKVSGHFFPRLKLVLLWIHGTENLFSCTFMFKIDLTERCIGDTVIIHQFYMDSNSTQTL